jgi:hypothetical protein
MSFKKIPAGTLLVILMGVMQSCYYDNTAELYPKANADTAVSYSKRIAPIISTNNCLTCHTGTNPSGGFRLETYDEVKTIALDKSKGPDGRLYGAVAQLPGYVPMPQGGGRLPDADINAIKNWVIQGAKNN